MPFIADLHVHSHYPRATSKSSTLPGVAAWAAVKGIDLVATGDFTHPGWFAHLCEHLKQTPSAAALAALLEHAPEGFLVRPGPHLDSVLIPLRLQIRL